jgi:hypothetical protein
MPAPHLSLIEVGDMMEAPGSPDLWELEYCSPQEAAERSG